MSFEPKSRTDGKNASLPVTASEVLTRFSRCKMSSGYLVTGATDDDESEYVCLETVTGGTSDGDVYCNVVLIDDEMVFHALCTTTPVQATHVGNDYGLSGAASVLLTDTSDKNFHVDKVIDATNKIVEGRFNKPSLA